MTEFDCIDCKSHVFAPVLEQAPEPPLCEVCRFLRGVDDPAKREAIRKVLNG